jgi:hypothetical protein
MTLRHVAASHPHNLCACPNVNASPGISRYSPRMRRTRRASTARPSLGVTVTSFSSVSSRNSMAVYSQGVAI